MFLHNFLEDLNKFEKLKTSKKKKRKEKKRKKETEMKKKTNVHDKASELYNEFPEIYYNEHCYLSHAKIKQIVNINLKSRLLNDMIIVCAKT